MMVDSGATNNFISTATVNRLQIEPAEEDKYGVTLGDGKKNFGKGKCRGLQMLVQGLEITEDYLILGLGNSDIIFGMQWLKKLGEVVTNWKKQIMKFNWEGAERMLVGDPSLERSLMSLKALRRAWDKGDRGVLVEINQVEKSGKPLMKIPVAFQHVVKTHEEVFSEPKGLPPNREKNHTINLKDGTSPVSVRSCRYPQIRKDEIERMVRDMLDAHIIRPSTSPFSSPVLLVMKKDGSWRFCIDYRA